MNLQNANLCKRTEKNKVEFQRNYFLFQSQIVKSGFFFLLGREYHLIIIDNPLVRQVFKCMM